MPQPFTSTHFPIHNSLIALSLNSVWYELVLCVFVQVVICLTCTGEVLSLNLSEDTNYPNWWFCNFCHPRPPSTQPSHSSLRQMLNYYFELWHGCFLPHSYPFIRDEPFYWLTPWVRVTVSAIKETIKKIQCELLTAFGLLDFLDLFRHMCWTIIHHVLWQECSLSSGLLPKQLSLHNNYLHFN